MQKQEHYFLAKNRKYKGPAFSYFFPKITNESDINKRIYLMEKVKKKKSTCYFDQAKLVSSDPKKRMKNQK